ncbi:VanZ family protein [Psychrobacillus sp. FSL W7-1457]|uniref:VanZ family protein n=1 Tax=Psychrobacillus sp. FSL W7-1457 TaxID=2954547 RepID=UPI00315A6E93
MKKYLNIFYWGILFFYLFLLIDTVFLGRGSFRSVNFVPLNSIREYIMVDNGIGGTRIVDMNIWGNVLMFIPAGIYLSLHSSIKSIARVLCSIFLLSLFIEVVQYIFELGATDIDDIILNFIGGFLGVIIYKIAEKFLKEDSKIKNFISILSVIVGLPIFVLLIIIVIVNID